MMAGVFLLIGFYYNVIKNRTPLHISIFGISLLVVGWMLYTVVIS